MARPRRSEPVTIVEHRAKSRSEQAKRKIAEHRAKTREEPEGAVRRRASAKDFAAQVRSQHAAMFRRDPPEGVRLKRRNCSGVSTTEAPRKIPQSSSFSGRRAAARGGTAAGGTTPKRSTIGTRSSGEEHVATPRGRKKRTSARQDIKCERGSMHKGTPASTGRQTKRPALQNKQKNTEIMRRALQRLKQNHQWAVLRRTRHSSAERRSTIETVGSTNDGCIPCIRQKGAKSQEGSPRSTATSSSAARGANMLHTSENTGTGSESSGGIKTGAPRNAVLEEMLPFIVESLKRIELRLHSLERRCDGFSEAFHELRAALSTRHQSDREEEHVPSAAPPLPGMDSWGNSRDRSLPISTMQSHSRNNKDRSPSAITDHTCKGLPTKGVTSALQTSESPSPRSKPCASSLGVLIGSAQNVEAVDTGTPRVLAAMRSRGVSNPVHSISSPDSVEVPVAPIADHLMPGVTNTDALGRVLPSIRKDAPLFSITMADGRKYMGDADDGEPDVSRHDVAVGAITISSKKDEGETATSEAGGSSLSLRQNEAKIVDSPSRDEVDQCKGVHVEVSDVQTVVDDISLSSSSCSGEEERDETFRVEGATSLRWQTGSAPRGQETCGKGDRRKHPHSNVSNTMSVCAALGVTSSISKNEGNAAADSKKAGSSVRRKDAALAREHVYHCSGFMSTAATNNAESDDDEYDFQPVKLARSKRPWMTPALEASIRNVKKTDPLAWFDAHDGEVSLGVLSGGGNKGMFGLRSRKKLDPSRKADPEQEKTESGDAIDVLKAALSTTRQQPHREEEHILSAAPPRTQHPILRSC